MDLNKFLIHREDRLVGRVTSGWPGLLNIIRTVCHLRRWTLTLILGAAGLPSCCRGGCALLQSLQEGKAIPDPSLPHLQDVSPFPSPSIGSLSNISARQSWL